MASIAHQELPKDQWVKPEEVRRLSSPSPLSRLATSYRCYCTDVPVSLSPPCRSRHSTISLIRYPFPFPHLRTIPIPLLPSSSLLTTDHSLASRSSFYTFPLRFFVHRLSPLRSPVASTPLVESSRTSATSSPSCWSSRLKTPTALPSTLPSGHKSGRRRVGGKRAGDDGRSER